MKVVIAPDKFKGSLTAAEVADAVAHGLLDEKPGLEIACIPVADGGDGTVAAAVAAGWKPVIVVTSGPTGAPTRAMYATRGTSAVIELAAAVGLALLPAGELKPLSATTFGLGAVIADAVERGARDIVVCLGGSASTDGGAGVLQALGAQILDAEGNELPHGGGALKDAARLDLSGLHPKVRSARFLLACDVDNPLLGPNGAAAVYGPQKGANAAEIQQLDANLRVWSEVVRTATSHDLASTPGAGAAGGTAFGLMAVLGARPQSGIELVLDLVGFAKKLPGAQLVITGEGSLDEQSLHGKAPIGVAERARHEGIPVVAVAGRSVLDDSRLHEAGISSVYVLSDLEPDPAASMNNAAALLRQLGRRIAAENFKEKQ